MAENSNCWRDPSGKPSNPEAHPFRVTLFHHTSAPGLHGWASRSQVFATLDDALTVAAMPMSRGQYRIDVDVAKNRAEWSERGEWEQIGRRLNGKSWTFRKGWDMARVLKVREWFAKRGM